MYVAVHHLRSEIYQPQTQYLAIPRLSSLLLGCLVIPREVVCLGIRHSKVLSSKQANRPPSGCSETKQLPKERGVEFLATILPAKRTRPLPPSKPASLEMRLDNQLPNQRITPLEAEPASLGARPHPPLV